MSIYKRKTLTEVDLDNIRIELSARQTLIAENDLDNIQVLRATRKFKLHDDPVCDFCGDHHPLYCYASSRTSTGEYRECWRWCACADCADAVEAMDWGHLEKKIADWLSIRVKNYPYMVLSEIAHRVFQEFKRYAVPE
jgi:hypothetical protein